MDSNTMISALKKLDHKLSGQTNLLIGGGAAMMLAHGFSLSTLDIDGLVFKSKVSQAEVDNLAKQIAKESSIPYDWLNSHFNTFLYTLPSDYDTRLIEIYSGKNLKVFSLSAEDLLILKCFAGRPKDKPHVRALFKKITNRDLVENHLQLLVDKNIPKSTDALDFFDELSNE